MRELPAAGLPASPESEKAILAGILLDNTLSDEVLAALRPEHFFLDAHRRIFNRICDLFETSRPIDSVTLTEELGKHKELKAVGGVEYLCGLTDGVIRKSNLKHYIDIVVDKFTLRQMVHAAEGIMSSALDSAAVADEVVSNAEASILNVAAEGDGEAVRIGEVTDAVEARILEGRKANKERTALELSWGISGLDSFSKGLYSGELTVLAGESGRGKTVMALQVTLENAREGTPVAWFSLEMPREKLTQRLYPQMSEIITSTHIRDPRTMNEETHLEEVIRLSREIQQLPIWVDDSSALPIKKLVARIRMMRRKLGIRLYVIDYMQLIEPTHSDRDGSGVKEIIFALRDLVKVEPIHILLLSQYSKADGLSKKRRRSRSDLYGGSVIHHAAQNVVLMSVEDGEGKDKGELLDVEFRIDKQRDGRQGKVTCMFDPQHLRYCYAVPPIR